MGFICHVDILAWLIEYLIGGGVIQPDQIENLDYLQSEVCSQLDKFNNEPAVNDKWPYYDFMYGQLGVSVYLFQKHRRIDCSSELEKILYVLGNTLYRRNDFIYWRDSPETNTSTGINSPVRLLVM